MPKTAYNISLLTDRQRATLLRELIPLIIDYAEEVDDHNDPVGRFSSGYVRELLTNYFPNERHESR